MSYRIRIALVLAFVLSSLFAIPVMAGGWAVITLDELPVNVVAGEPLAIGFTVRQHGLTLRDGLDPIITVHLDKTNSFVVHAEQDDAPGHYTATLTFPTAGEWQWSIQAFMDQPMPALTVAPAVAPSASEPIVVSAPESKQASFPVVWLIRGLALGLGALGLFLALRNRSRLAYGLVVLGLGVGIGSFVTGPAVPTVEAEEQVSVEVVSTVEALSDVEVGERLFVAKGCVTCHVNRKLDNSAEYWTIEMGAPDLTAFSASPEILFIRLKDPTAAKSDTKMPNLGLKKEEIEALIAFINSQP